jgi:hypothetical protein
MIILSFAPLGAFFLQKLVISPMIACLKELKTEWFTGGDRFE